MQASGARCRYLCESRRSSKITHLWVGKVYTDGSRLPGTENLLYLIRPASFFINILDYTQQELAALVSTMSMMLALKSSKLTHLCARKTYTDGLHTTSDAVYPEANRSTLAVSLAFPTKSQKNVNVHCHTEYVRSMYIIHNKRARIRRQKITTYTQLPQRQISEWE